MATYDWLKPPKKKTARRGIVENSSKKSSSQGMSLLDALERLTGSAKTVQSSLGADAGLGAGRSFRNTGTPALAGMTGPATMGTEIRSRNSLASAAPAAQSRGTGGFADGSQSAGDIFDRNNTDPITGPISDFDYLRGQLPNIYENPTILTEDILKAMGINNYGMAEQLAEGFAPAMAAWAILTGGKGDVSDVAALNAITNQLQQQMTENGRMPEFDVLMDAIMGMTDPDMGPIANTLNTGTPGQQVDATNALMRQTLPASGMAPIMQAAYRNAYDYYSKQYMGNLTRGDVGTDSSYVDYLGKSPLAKWY